MTWTTENYLTKAHIYWERGSNQERGSNEHIFSVFMCVELTIRGALCFYNPALNSANDEESIMFSVGVTPNKPQKSINLDSALNRLIRLIPEFTENEQKAVRALIDLRNRELHSDESAFEVDSTNKLFPGILSFLVRVSDKISYCSPPDGRFPTATRCAISWQASSATRHGLRAYRRCRWKQG